MEVVRYKYIFVSVTLLLTFAYSEELESNPNGNNTAICPLSKIIEDIFKIHNRTGNRFHLKDNERAKLFLSSIKNITNPDVNYNEEKLVDDIIASINRIKNNITNDTKTNEATIVYHQNSPNDKDNSKSSFPIKSGIEEKIDLVKSQKHSDINHEVNATANRLNSNKANFVEILTIEPNNTSINNTSSHNIIEVLKHLMPMFNSTLTKELHNITIIERNHNKNHSYSATKNVSTIVITYCDKENLTTLNHTTNSTNVTEKTDINDDDYYLDDMKNNDYDNDQDDHEESGEKEKISEAIDYGINKINELFNVVEPKLYSMGFWIDDTNPAHYVAAFNAPSEDSAKFTRYGHASLQAATRFKQLNSGDLEGRTEEIQFPAASALRESTLIQHCPLRGAPKCPPASKRYRTHDGTCNNLHRPRWGSTMTPVQRFLAPSYSDGLQAPRRSIFGSQLPSAREISSLIHEDQNVEHPGITHLLMQWGQFLDHDITSSSQSRGFNGSVPRCCKDGGRDFVPKEFMHPECFPIAVPATDPFYGPRGVRCLDFIRSAPAPRDDCALGWREQLNQVSAYIDGSPLYASSARQSDRLRLFRNGMLQYGRVQQRRPVLPPERKDELCRGGAVSTDCFKSGDARVNEHPGLVAAHIVWLRQHNRMAQELAHLNPHWSDEKIYQETRRIVGAMIQLISYREFLPIILGTEVMRLFELEPQKKGYFKSYNPKINPSPASSFGSAAFRFGHSLVQPSMMRYDRFHRPINNNVSLHNELTNPSNIWSMGAVDRLLLGMMNQPIQKRDEFITEELTNHLFQTPQFDFGMDLAAINIQRGRDHGVPPYTSWREPCGLSAIIDFEDLLRVMPTRTVRKLKALYRNVDDIDLFTGGMAERPVVGGLVGPTFACIIAQQFSNLRKGDRFWYENGGLDSSFTPAQLQQIRRISFAQILCRTLDTIESIQPFVFLSPDNPDNDRIPCHNGLLNNFDLSPWVEIDSDSNNDISKSDETSTQKPKPKSTTPKITTMPPVNTTKKNGVKITQRRPPVNSTKLVSKQKPNHKTNNTDTIAVDNDMTVKDTNDKNVVTKQNIDDKLDFKNKSRRYEDTYRLDTRHRPTKYSDYDYADEDDTQSVQSVVINNVPHKRPYSNRPVITVTENIDKYTYLINYVPRPTESWRYTTRRPLDRDRDRDIVKVTYQTYDDTYRRPSKPYYYNRRDDINFNDNDRRNRPNSYTTNKEFQSSARSNDKVQTTVKPVTDEIDAKLNNPTTDNLYKLVTFGYVGSYRGHDNMTGKLTNDKTTDLPEKDNDLTKKKTDPTDKLVNTDEKPDSTSKDFTTYDLRIDKTDQKDTKSDINENEAHMKLSTFYQYETATKPYNTNRPTRRNDEDMSTYIKTNSKYYYVKNVLHKYPEKSTIVTSTNNYKDSGAASATVIEHDPTKEIVKENYNSPGIPQVKIEERSSIDKMDFLEDIESKAATSNKMRLKIKKPANSGKTPSVAFEVIPSENSPSKWAVYEENDDILQETIHRMPTIKSDPSALKEIPRPLDLSAALRRRHPGRF